MRLRLPDLVADVDDLYHPRSERGRAAARLWYHRQVLAAMLRVPGAIFFSPRPPGPPRGAKRFASAAREVRLALRRIRRAPGLALSFALVIGLGMAATSFMAQVRSDLLHPDLGLGRDVAIVHWTDGTGLDRLTIPLAGTESWLTDPPAAATALVPLWPSAGTLDTPEGRVRASGQRVRPGFLAKMGTAPALGRDLEREGDVLLSDRLWRVRWGKDRGAVGRPTKLDGRIVRVVGVAPAGFDGPVCCAPPAFWFVHEESRTATPAVVTVLEPRDPEAVAAWLTRAIEPADRGPRARLDRAESAPYGGDAGFVGRTLALLLALAGVAWVGTLFGGANLLVADALERSAEHRLRRALGSDGLHLAIREIAAVGWMALLAATVAVLVAWGLTAVAPWFLPMVGDPNALEVALGRQAVAAAAVTAAAAALACAVPAVLVALRDRGPAFHGRRVAHGGSSATAVVAQVAMGSLLMVVCALLVRSIQSMDGDFVGFRHGAVTVHWLGADPDEAPSPPQAILADVLALPGVRSVALSRYLTIFGARRDSIRLPDGVLAAAVVERVTRDWFETVGAELLAGTPADRPDEAVVTADLAARIAPDAAGAVGRTLLLDDTLPVRVVGTAESATWGSGSPRPAVYLGWGVAPVHAGFLLVRPTHPGALPTGRLLEALRGRGLAMESYQTLDALLLRSRILSVFLARLALLFTVLSLAVVAGGVHAHFLRWVRSRNRELGIRAALGARGGGLRVRVLGAALRLVLPGAGLGCTAGLIAASLASRLLGDPIGPFAALGRLHVVTLAAIAVTMVIVCGASLVVPLARASSANPVELLRAE